MYRISTMNKIAAIGLDRFDREQYEVASELNNPDAIIVRSAKLHDMEMPATLKAIARAGAGVNNIPVADCTAKGIVVFNTPGANANAVKELVIAALLLASRGIIKGVEWTNTLKGTENISKQVEDGKKNFAGTEIKGKTLGIIGLGAIGVSLANAALALGMNVAGYDPYISVEAAWGLSSQVKRAKSLDSLLSKADYISIHVPFLPDTKDMIKKEKFALMKDGVKIVNFSRDGIINTADMVEALDAGKVSCYVTDFAEEALLQRDDVIVMPHKRIRRQLRHDGGRRNQTLPRNGKCNQFRQLPRVRTADGRRLPHRSGQQKRSEHAGTDHFDSGQRRHQHYRFD